VESQGLLIDLEEAFGYLCKYIAKNSKWKEKLAASALMVKTACYFYQFGKEQQPG